MSDPEAPQRSSEACPECGRHELELIGFPDISVKGVTPYDELIGMGDPRRDHQPGIGCRACGASWHDLADFHAAQKERRDS